MSKIKLMFLMMSFLLVQACANQPTSNNPEVPQAEASITPKFPDSRLEGQWKIYHIKGVKLLKNTQTIYLKVDLKKKTVSGSDSCNNFGGAITTLTDSQLVFGDLVSTLKFCPEVEYTSAFHTALQETTSYKIEAEKLHLFNQEGEEVLTFVK